MASEDPQQLIDDIIRFIETERELYGDFTPARPSHSASTTAAKPDDNNTVSEVSEPDSESDVEEDTKQAQQIEPEDKSAVRSNTQPEAKSSAEDDNESQKVNLNMDAQEGIFDDGSDREVYYKIKDCKTLEELKTLCQEADVLRTDLAGTNLVFGVGNPNADLMLIGEAPGAEEDKQGEPFVGAAGQLLNKIMGAINFERDDIYIANILKHRPPNNRNPKPEERERSLPFLLKQIDLIRPKLILSLGKVSAQTLLDNDNSLSSMRGKFHSFRGQYELMATYHPAALLRHAKWKRPTWEDVQLLRKRYDELGCKP